MSNVLENSILGFCKWDILALIVLAVVVVVFEVRQRKLKKRQRELEERLSGIYADDTFKASQ